MVTAAPPVIAANQRLPKCGMYMEQTRIYCNNKINEAPVTKT